MEYQWKIIGHGKQLNVLEHSLRTNSLGHAYLFSGTGSIGKFTIARDLACIIQCPNHFCKTCQTCVQVKKGGHLDTIELNDDGESVKIEQIREIIMRLNMTGQSRRKILLIKNIERLTDEASNCLLKILEEPPSNTIFLFTTRNSQEILGTVCSRMRIIKFTAVPENTLRMAMREQFPEVDERLLDEIIMLSLGKPGRTIDMLHDNNKLEFFRELYRTVQKMCENKSVAERFILGLELTKENATLREFFDMLMYYVRNKLLCDDTQHRSLITTLELIQKTKELHKKNINARLLVENLILKLG